ncbi:hypothetical protein GCM10007857_77720 [Bradyrhizobium iriomotense]|uniref:Uncharacterized protein n=1 Tax=Bradyrhizobium iriomotense TaxID=441950 RepID=A0ABQ6BEJ4_9BRAD|nr:hypothetical protein GCM10007857_77720 [Bradyrhizobium iriomotense]
MIASVPLQAPTGSRRGCRHGYLHAKDLAYEPVLRELNVRYKGSALGIVWSLLSPLSPVHCHDVPVSLRR